MGKRGDGGEEEEDLVSINNTMVKEYVEMCNRMSDVISCDHNDVGQI